MPRRRPIQLAEQTLWQRGRLPDAVPAPAAPVITDRRRADGDELLLGPADAQFGAAEVGDRGREQTFQPPVPEETAGLPAGGPPAERRRELSPAEKFRGLTRGHPPRSPPGRRRAPGR